MSDKIRLEDNDYDDADEYEPTDSEDEYSEGEKELLREARQRRKREDVDHTKELMAFDESDDEDDVQDLMRDSDIEGAESDDDELPDTREWGKKSKNYYNTDFVDPDYSTYTAEQEEMAREEEEEAKKIQLRLAKQMKEEDFLLDKTILDSVKPKRTTDQIEKQQSIQITADLTGMPKRDKLRLFQEDSPEFGLLTSDFESYLKETELITPVMQYVHTNKVPMIPALQFAQLYQDIMLSYCSNVSFYLLLKSKRVSVRNHPVTKRLLQFKKLLQQLKDKYDNIIRPQLEALLERITDGDKFEVLQIKSAQEKSKRKTRLGILEQFESNEKPNSSLEVDETTDDDESSEDQNNEVEDVEICNDDYSRRGITYQMAKNKGLMPARKKESRNPRVKHRNKFRKALVRRKGAVRTVRTETKRYGGEISGIKATVSKSIKFKV